MQNNPNTTLITAKAPVNVSTHGGRAKCLQRLIRLELPVPTTVAPAPTTGAPTTTAAPSTAAPATTQPVVDEQAEAVEAEPVAAESADVVATDDDDDGSNAVGIFLAIVIAGVLGGGIFLWLRNRSTA